MNEVSGVGFQVSGIPDFSILDFGLRNGGQRAECGVLNDRCETDGWCCGYRPIEGIYHNSLKCIEIKIRSDFKVLKTWSEATSKNIQFSIFNLQFCLGVRCTAFG